MERGGFRIETRSTAIEDGPSAWLNQLAAALDRAALPDAG
jgi:flagellar assembly protein FliH